MSTDDTTQQPSEDDPRNRRRDADARGEHRYPDESQTEDERRGRQDRDDLRRRMERGS